ncbi:MAG: tail fiber protein [Bacteroidota bacterium]
MEGMIGEIRMFGGNFAPRTWALCNGQLLPIAQNTALFSIIGTIYGGDGRTTFALPDIRGRAVIGPGNGPGLPNYREGKGGGVERYTIAVTELPAHNHLASIKANNAAGTSNTPEDNYFATVFGRANTSPPSIAQLAMYASTANGTLRSDAVALANTGGGQAVENMMPFTTVNYVICLQGVFPSRS